MFTDTLRKKFLFSGVLISALLTSAVMLTVRYRVQLHERQGLKRAIDTSVVTFQSLQRQRESTLERSAALLATLPPLKALMTSTDPPTIQDASAMFWELAGSQVFVLADRSGTVAALHTSAPGFPTSAAQQAITRGLADGESRDWWSGGGRLYQVFLQPIYFGAREVGNPIGLLAVGYEIDAEVAADVGRVASSHVGFAFGKQLVVTTVPEAQREDLARHVAGFDGSNGGPEEIRLGTERFLATSVRLSSAGKPPVTLTVLKSVDQAMAYLQSLNRWIVAIGAAGVLAASQQAVLVSTSFTKPLGRLVAGVQALEGGDFDYPLDLRGRDEVSELTAAFHRMRQKLQDTQRQLVDAERLATIGRMANTISHDLRHPLTAILAYAEFLSERTLSDAQRKDFFEEIRIAVNRMTDEINSLLGFSKQGDALRPASTPLDEVISRAIRTVKALPEFESLSIAFTHDEDCAAWCDPGKLERVILNLLFNAGDAVPPLTGRIEISCTISGDRAEIRVADNGPGIPQQILGNLYQPFVSYGKEQGIGLGLTVVQNIMQQHGGEVCVERTGADGTVMRLTLPRRAAAESRLG